MARWGLRGWLSRLLSHRRHRGGVDAREARAVIAAYATCLERRAADGLGAERDLPYSKETIGRVILRALEFAADERLVAPLRQGFVDLETFLGDEEWAVVEEYQRLAKASSRADAAIDILAQVEERRDRRRQLLAILARERAARAAGGNGQPRE